MAATLFSPNFVIGHIRIGSVEGASCVNMGNNFPSHFQSQKKHNQGFGEISGNDNRLSGAKAVLDDADWLDWFSGDAAQTVPEPLRRWFEELARETAVQVGEG